MDKLDLGLITFIYLLRTTLTILSVAMFLLPTPGNLGIAIRRGAPWMAIISLHTTSLSIHSLSIQKLMETFPTFMVLCLAMFYVTSLSTIGRLAQNGAIWIAIICIHPILFGLSALHRLIQISIYQDRTELWYANLYRAIMSVLAQVLLQSFQVETELTNHLGDNNQAGTPWRKKSTQAFKYNRFLESE